MEGKYSPTVMIEINIQNSKPQAMNHKPQTLGYDLKPGPKCEKPWGLHITSREIRQEREFPQYANDPGLKGQCKNSRIETMRSRDTGRPQKWGQSLKSPILPHRRRAQQVELKKVYDIFIVDNPGLETRWFEGLVCSLCIYYPSSVTNSTSFHYGVNGHLNNKFHGLSTYCWENCWRWCEVNRGEITLATGLQTKDFVLWAPVILKTEKPKERHHHWAEET